MTPNPPSLAKAIMVLGTTSHAGKTVVAAGLCRLLARRGVKVAPFKAQNMSLNSHVTPEGAEIGRAQAMQARAAGIDSHSDMNPVLLKPSGNGISQVILNGRPHGNRSAREYYSEKAFLGTEARLAYDRLASRFDVVVLEGAGSPAEINLRAEDFVNGAMAEHAGARCLLVADIERGGVFASILGTVQLLEPRHRSLLAGVVINKFRGDVTLLDPGIREIEALTGVPVLGIIPWLEDLALEEEDSLGLPTGDRPSGEGGSGGGGGGGPWLDIAVIRLPHISNFTDFQPFQSSPGLRLRYVTDPASLGNPDLLILPGSKSVRTDLAWLASTGLDRVVTACAERHIPILGICGGYQMLGRQVRDPHGIESDPGDSPGLGLLPLITILEKEKDLSRVEGRNLALPFLSKGQKLAGYEIHMGQTTSAGPPRPIMELISRNGTACRLPSGTVADDRPVMGAYLHGLFEDADVRSGLRDWLLRRRGLDGGPAPDPLRPADAGFDLLADVLESHIDLKLILASK